LIKRLKKGEAERLFGRSWSRVRAEVGELVFLVGKQGGKEVSHFHCKQQTEGGLPGVY